jgi:hypothetical protein
MMTWDQLQITEMDRTKLKQAIADPLWQTYKLDLVLKEGCSHVRRRLLECWLEDHGFSIQSRIQVSNLVKTWVRSGLVKPYNLYS